MLSRMASHLSFGFKGDKILLSLLGVTGKETHQLCFELRISLIISTVTTTTQETSQKAGKEMRFQEQILLEQLL